MYLNPDILDGLCIDNVISEESDELGLVDPDFVDLFSIVEEDVDLWNQVAKQDNITVYSKANPSSPAILLKAYAYLSDVTIEDVCMAITNTEIRKQWDRLLHEFRVIENDIESGDTVFHFIIQTPFGISNRDFL